MPLCSLCRSFFPPNYTEVIPNSRPDNQGNYPQQCIFCKLNITQVEREETKDSGKFIPYTKEECIKDYQKFLRKVKDSQNVKDIIKKSQSMI